MRFRGGELFGNSAEVGEPWARKLGERESSSGGGILDQRLGVPPMGEGRGVMSDRGPTPGEDATDDGESPLPERCDALKDLTLELLTGRLAPEKARELSSSLSEGI